jgi:5-methylcytosine-specific restriction endonuclease McrA
MNNESLFQKVKSLVASERRIGIEILECLQEIDRRRAYAELRYDGLFTYCVKELGFTDSQAYQRIQAMRAVKEIPELKPLVESGSLSVSSISKVQTHLKHEKKLGIQHSRNEKFGLFNTFKDMTSREVDVKLAEVRGEVLLEKMVLELDPELVELWKRAKGLAAHRSAGGENAAVLKVLLKDWLGRNDPASKEPRRAVPSSTRVDVTASNDVSKRYISASLKQDIWREGGGKCARCGSRHAIEIDHVLPFALGGKTSKENLRLLCRSCNQFAATRAFGPAKIEKEIWRPSLCAERD